jgi:hypothetical protein
VPAGQTGIRSGGRRHLGGSRRSDHGANGRHGKQSFQRSNGSVPDHRSPEPWSQLLSPVRAYLETMGLNVDPTLPATPTSTADCEIPVVIWIDEAKILCFDEARALVDAKYNRVLQQGPQVTTMVVNV